MSDHYYTGLPLSVGKLYKIENIPIRGEFYSFYTAPGVFSSRKIDKGTLLLAEYMEVYEGRLLDLGCGIGVLGIVAAKSSPETQVILTDVNIRATWLAKKNVTMLTEAKLEEITDKGLTIITKEGVRQTITADTIIPALPLTPNTEIIRAMEGKVSTIGWPRRSPRMRTATLPLKACPSAPTASTDTKDGNSGPGSTGSCSTPTAR